MPSQKIPTNFVFTVQNPSQNLNPDPSRFVYVVWQLERAPTTGTLHYQGYAECKIQLTKQYNEKKKVIPTILHNVLLPSSTKILHTKERGAAG